MLRLYSIGQRGPMKIKTQTGGTQYDEEKVFCAGDVDFYDFQPVYEYLAKMYFKKYITEDMTYEEAEAVFDAFYEEITFDLENMTRTYTIDENTFMPTFEAYVEAAGIEK